MNLGALKTSHLILHSHGIKQNYLMEWAFLKLSNAKLVLLLLGQALWVHSHLGILSCAKLCNTKLLLLLPRPYRAYPNLTCVSININGIRNEEQNMILRRFQRTPWIQLPYLSYPYLCYVLLLLHLNQSWKRPYQIFLPLHNLHSGKSTFLSALKRKANLSQ